MKWVEKRMMVAFDQGLVIEPVSVLTRIGRSAMSSGERSAPLTDQRRAIVEGRGWCNRTSRWAAVELNCRPAHCFVGWPVSCSIVRTYYYELGPVTDRT